MTKPLHFYLIDLYFMYRFTSGIRQKNKDFAGMGILEQYRENSPHLIEKVKLKIPICKTVLFLYLK